MGRGTVTIVVFVDRLAGFGASNEKTFAIDEHGKRRNIMKMSERGAVTFFARFKRVHIDPSAWDEVLIVGCIHHACLLKSYYRSYRRQ